jgi:hypothetical protein
MKQNLDTSKYEVLVGYIMWAWDQSVTVDIFHAGDTNQK